jgi:hypothetical protein
MHLPAWFEGPKVNCFCCVSYYVGGLIIVLKFNQATRCIKGCISFMYSCSRNVGNGGTHFRTNFHENLYMGS